MQAPPRKLILVSKKSHYSRVQPNLFYFKWKNKQLLNASSSKSKNDVNRLHRLNVYSMQPAAKVLAALRLTVRPGGLVSQQTLLEKAAFVR